MSNNEIVCQCYTCKYRIPCEKEYGKLEEDVENCSAIEDSHFCRLSWTPFIEIMETKWNLMKQLKV